MSDGLTLRAVPAALDQAGRSQAGFRTGALSFQEIPNMACIRVRALPRASRDDTGGLSLPAETGRCTGADPAAMCLGPREWLIVSEQQEAAELLERVDSGIAGAGLHAWDDSDALGCFRIEGPAAPWLLRKLCGLDIPVHALPGEHCARTRLAHVSALIHHHVNARAGVFDLYVDRSVAPWVWDLLADSAPHACQLQAQFGVTNPARS